MKGLLRSAAVLLVAMVLLFGGTGQVVSATMPIYNDAVANENFTEKITGLYLMEQSAAREDHLLIFGSSELRTTDISTHPGNFFRGQRCGFQVDLIGRGSCQSLTHAIAIAASGDTLQGKKVVLITSPQGYLPEGIAPDLFMANFSPQQYMELMAAKDISPQIKQYISRRVVDLYTAYSQMHGAATIDPAVYWLAEHGAAPTPATAARNIVLAPYYGTSRYLLDIKDKTTAATLLNSLEDIVATGGVQSPDWEAELSAAITQAEQMTDNNDYGMLNDYYTTYIGSRLARQENQDAGLSYSDSPEYDDLSILLEICKEKGIEPLFVHVPMHGQWSDYTGFTAERRAEYYENVRQVVARYDVELLDLTTYEYEEYFLCDVMHLGWKGWLEIDRALIEYYYAD